MWQKKKWLAVHKHHYTMYTKWVTKFGLSQADVRATSIFNIKFSLASYTKKEYYTHWKL